MANVACPPHDQLSSFLSGQLDPPSAEALEEHVETCNRCQDTVRSLSVCGEPISQDLRAISAAPLELESGCKRAMARIQAFAGDRTVETIGYLLTELPKQPPEPELKTIREYQLFEKLGEGGMGAVYKAVHARLDKTVALKLLPRDRTRDPGAVARFQREMKAVGKLEHPHIVRAMDAGEVDGMHYLVMEYVPGMDLHQIAKRLGKLPVAEACELIRQAALGLAEAHEHGMVHRDIKPSNLILARPRRKQEQATVKVLDLGLALLSGEHAFADDGLTGTGQMMGTVDYMAPEQCRSSHDVDIRADVYSLGGTLYRLLSGSSPLGSDRDQSILSKLVALATKPVPPLTELRPDIPPEVRTIVHTMLAKEPGERFTTPEEVAEALSPFCSGADLKALLKQAEASPESADPAESKETLANRKSQLSDTQRLDSNLQPLSAGRGPRQWSLFVGAAGIPLFVVLCGVLWVIVKDRFGSEVGRMKVEPGGQAIVANQEDDKPVVPTPDGNDTPASAVAPFNTEKAKQHQQAWADHLSVPVEYENSLRMKFVLIPPGEFLMGTTQAEIEAALKTTGDEKRRQEGIKSEAPQHKVVLTKPFYLSIHEVTQKAYQVVTGKTPSAFARSGPDPELAVKVAGIDTADHPVEMVTWNDAEKFCNTLSQKENLRPLDRAGAANSTNQATGYRLPTEAEWEFACRAGTLTSFCNGGRSSDVLRVGWTYANSSAQTHTVGALESNPFGLFDMHGNVAEWVDDSWEPSFYGQFLEKAATDPRSPFSAGSDAVVRGGNYSFHETLTRAGYRQSEDPMYYRTPGIGFRVALSVDAVKQMSRAPRQQLISDKPNYALAFNGQVRAKLPSLDVDRTKPFTIEAWVILTKSPDSSGTSIVNLSPSTVLRVEPNGKWAFSIERLGVARSQVAPVLGRWTHVAGVRTDKEAILYLDGNIVAREKLGEDRSLEQARCYIGNAGDYPFEGQIDQVRISRGARYTKEFKPVRHLESEEKTLAIYYFDEGRGVDFRDSSGNGHHGFLEDEAYHRLANDKAVGRWVRVNAGVSSGASEPLVIAEPPPLADWLKGRTIRTVAQDGSGEFNTIQEALNALKARQVIQVVDRGPYRERLARIDLPNECGLISEKQTVLELTDWGLRSDTNSPVGHELHCPGDFRLQGFAFAFPSGKKDAHGLYLRYSGPLVIEDCYAQAVPKNELFAAVMLNGWGQAELQSAWVRDCFFRGQLIITATNPDAIGVVERNYLSGPGNQSLACSGEFNQLQIRHNVLGGEVVNADMAFELERLKVLCIRNNSSLAHYPPLFAKQVPAGEVIFVNNLRTEQGLLALVAGAEKGMPTAISTWRTGFNAYSRQIRGGEFDLPKQSIFPAADGDIIGEVTFLSSVATEVDYLRLRPQSKLATEGAGGDLPTYIGALPPGPVPKGGDWFTRLRERWAQP